jgi:hypothetical protein
MEREKSEVKNPISKNFFRTRNEGPGELKAFLETYPYYHKEETADYLVIYYW